MVRLAWSSAVQEQLLSGKMVRHIKKTPLPLRDSELTSSVVVKLCGGSQGGDDVSKVPTILDKSPWDSKSITAILRVSQVIFKKEQCYRSF